MSQGGMQLTHDYRVQLDPKFIAWYLREFKNSRMVYIHWSVTGRCSDDAAYHREVQQDENGRVWTLNNIPCDQDLKAHTYGRNTNSCAICVASMAGGDTNDLGPNAPTPAQLVELIRATSETCRNLRIPVSNVMTHAEAADNVDGYDGYDPYGPYTTCERWDFHTMIDVKTMFMKPAFNGGVAMHPGDAPDGSLYFADWLRGEAIKRIQDITAHVWH